MAEPLNPELYSLLQRWKGDVHIVCPQGKIDWYVVYKTVRRSDGSTKQVAERKVKSPGEEYVISCPLCKDTTRKRLYINHRWGVWDPETESQNLFLAQCYNEGCIDNGFAMRALHNLVFASGSKRVRDGHIRVAEGTKVVKVGEVSPPGVMLTLKELKERHPSHDAITYLENRGFSIKELSRRYNVSYCLHSKYNLAKNRIIIPMYREGVLVGWQARYAGDNVNGRSFKEASVPKFWSCPGMVRRMLAYNMETAVKHNTILIEEGPTDVWRSGPMAMGLLGKTMNRDLVARFAALVRKHHGDKEPPLVCVVLDPLQDEKQKAKGKPHHIDVVVGQMMELGLPTFGLRLPDELDPGSMERRTLWEFVRREAKKHGYKATFTRPRTEVA